MKALFENLLSSFSSPNVPQLSEAEHLLAEIEEARAKIKYAWNRLDFAAPEYVEIAVLELLLVETQYCLLNRRYRLLQGIEKEPPYLSVSEAKSLPFSLERQLQNHAFYRALIHPPEENSATDIRQLMSQNPYI